MRLENCSAGFPHRFKDGNVACLDLSLNSCPSPVSESHGAHPRGTSADLHQSAHAGADAQPDEPAVGVTAPAQVVAPSWPLYLERVKDFKTYMQNSGS